MSHSFKYLRLESYEDALNNLEFRPLEKGSHGNDFQREYFLNYWLQFETSGSPSLLNVDGFVDPENYLLNVKKPGGDEYSQKNVDLIETFNWLIGLSVEHLDHWRGFDASFKRETDPELPDDSGTRLILDSSLKESEDGAWRIRKIEGYTLKTPGDPSDKEKALGNLAQALWRP